MASREKVKALPQILPELIPPVRYAFECAGLDRFVLRHDHRAIVFAKNEMRAGLAKLDETETFNARMLQRR